jgi:ribose transport system substrate-binding protein
MRAERIGIVLLLALAGVFAAVGTARSTSDQGAGPLARGGAALGMSKASCNSLQRKPRAATIAYMPPGLEFPYYIGIGQGVKIEAKKYGYKVITSAPVSGADYAGQAARMRDVVHRGVDGIIFHTHNNSATAPLIKDAVAKGIAVVIVNQDLTAFPAPIHAVVGYRERKTDYKMGQYGVKLMHGKANIGLIAGLPGYDSTERIGGFKDGIKGHSDMKVAAEVVGNWDVPGGNKAALDMLQGHPEINLIFAANDFMAEGAYQAAKTLHRTGLSILGSDGDTNAFELIYNGGKGSAYKATMNTVPVLQGLVAMRAMHACLAHTFKGFYVETPGTLVTKANVLKVLKNYALLWPKPKHRY